MSIVYRFVRPGTILQPGGLGTIEDLAATAGDTTLALTWTPAENATSHQPQYKASASETWLDFGSALGAEAASVTITGLTNGTAYDTRVVASDGSTTTTSNVVQGTPVAASFNEPAGMTTLADTDGSVIASGGNALGVSWFGAWNIGSGDMANHINVVADAGTVSGSALRLEFNNSYNPNCAQVSGRWGPNYDEIYVRLELMYETGWNQGHKLFYIHSGPGSSDDIFLTRAANGWMQLNDQAGANVIFEEFSPLATLNQWYTVELLLTNGAGTGTAKLWVDDVLLQDVSGITWGADGNFQGLEFFYDTEEALTQSFMRMGAFYASGRAA